MMWALQTMKDLVVSKLAHPKELNARALSGKSGNKGEIALWLMKQKFLRWLTSSWMQSIGFGVDDLKLFGGELSDHQAFRQLCGYPGESSHDIAWQAHLSASARKAVTFLEQMIFGARFDPSWKLSMKGSSEPAEIAKTEPFKDSLLEIEELVVKDEPKMDIEAEQQRDNADTEKQDALRGKVAQLLSPETFEKASEEQRDDLCEFLNLCVALLQSALARLEFHTLLFLPSCSGETRVSVLDRRAGRGWQGGAGHGPEEHGACGESQEDKGSRPFSGSTPNARANLPRTLICACLDSTGMCRHRSRMPSTGDAGLARDSAAASQSPRGLPRRMAPAGQPPAAVVRQQRGRGNQEESDAAMELLFREEGSAAEASEQRLGAADGGTSCLSGYVPAGDGQAEAAVRGHVQRHDSGTDRGKPV